MAKLEPMLLTETWDKQILSDATKWFQIKENGIRAIAHIKNGKIVGLRSRSDSPILYMFPELKELTFPVQEAILDGELCVFKDGKSHFYGGIDKRRSAPTERTLTDYPVSYVVFDAIKLNADVLVAKPYSERYSKLCELLCERLVVGSTIFCIAKNYTDGLQLWNEVVEKDLEGVVVKSPSSFYELGVRSKSNLKLKNYKITDVIVDSVEPNKAGTKIYGTAPDGTKVECQLGGVFNVEVGSTQVIKYLDRVQTEAGVKYIQPTKTNREQLDGTKS